MSLSMTSFITAGASTVTATFTEGLSVHSVTSSNLVSQLKLEMQPKIYFQGPVIHTLKSADTHVHQA